MTSRAEPVKKAPRRRAWNQIVPSPQEQRNLKLEALYETAARSFNRRGFHGTSLADLATELGVTKAALYHYVDNKKDLLYRLHTLSLRAANDSLDLARREGRNGLEKVRLTIYNYLLRITKSRTTCLVLFEDDAMTAGHAKDVLERSREVEHALRDLVCEGIADGSIVPCDAKLATFILVASMNWVSRWYDPADAWTGDQIADGMSAMLARGLARHPAEALPSDIGSLALTPVTTQGGEASALSALGDAGER